jgi:hypothetical protein
MSTNFAIRTLARIGMRTWPGRLGPGLVPLAGFARERRRDDVRGKGCSGRHSREREAPRRESSQEHKRLIRDWIPAQRFAWRE